VEDLGGNAGRRRRRRTFLDRIGEVLLMRNLMKVEEMNGVCKDCSKWQEIISWI
jgi:hypothetical protein